MNNQLRICQGYEESFTSSIQMPSRKVVLNIYIQKSETSSVVLLWTVLVITRFRLLPPVDEKPMHTQKVRLPSGYAMV